MGRKLHYSICLFFAGLYLFPVSGQYYPVGSRIQGLAGAGIVLEDPFSSFCNQAGLAGFKSIVVAATHEMPYLINGLSVSSVSFVIPASPGVFSFNGSSAGFSLWKESRAGLAFARKFGSRLSAGIQIDGFFARMPDVVPMRPVFTWEMGILSQPLPDLLIGLHLFNPVRADYPDTRNQRLPVSLAFGAGYRPVNTFLLTMEVEKELLYPLSFRAGIEFEPVTNFFLRYGYNSVKGHATGVGFRTRHLSIDVAFSRHFHLGYSPSISFGYVFR